MGFHLEAASRIVSDRNCDAKGVAQLSLDLGFPWAPGELRVLVTTQYVNLADEALHVVGGHAARILWQVAGGHEPDTEG
jgi:hypothetical protein